jgi:hypothetical protein
MNQRRSFDEHIQLFVVYAAHVAALSPAAWDRLRLRCADLDRPAFRSLLQRARVAAKPFELFLTPTARRAVAPRIIARASRVFQVSLAIAGQVAAEFEGAGSESSRLPRRTRSTGKQSTDAYIDANFLIESTLTSFERTNPGVVTALRAAGQAVLHHDWLAQADFDAVYMLVEQEIPFADLAPPSTGL